MPRSEPFPRIIGDLAAKKATGVLKVTAGSVEREIFLKQGRVIQARSRTMKEALGRVLIDQGWVSEEQLDVALAHAAEAGMQLGDCLVSTGVLSPEQVVEALTEQVKLRVYNLFRVPDYRWSFDEGPLPELHFQVRLPVAELVVEGVGFCFAVDRIMDELSLTEDTTVRATKDAGKTGERLHLGPREQRLLQRAAEPITVEGLIESGEHSYLKLLRFLFALWCLRLLEVVPRAEVKKEQARKEKAEREAARAEAAPEAPPADESDQSDKSAKAGKRIQLDVEEPDDPRRAALRRKLLDRYKKRSRQPTPTPRPTPAAGKKKRAPAVKKEKTPADELMAFYLRLPRMDYFQLLEIPVKAAVSDVKIAYGGFLRRWRLEHIPEDWPPKAKAAAAGLLDRATEALTVLNDPDGRRRYLEQRASGGARTLQGDEGMVIAGVAQQKARRARERGDFDGAEAILREALEKVPEEASLWLRLGIVLVDQLKKEHTAQQEEAVKVLRKAATLDPALDLPWVYIARVAEIRAEPELAKKLYRKALSVNPESELAASGLKSLLHADEKGTLLDRLLGKK